MTQSGLMGVPGRLPRHRTIVDVHVLLLDPAGRIFLVERANSGYADGQAGVPSGHLEAGESVVAAAIRETHEEVRVTIQPADLHCVHVSHRRKPGEEDRVGFFFTATGGTTSRSTTSHTSGPESGG